MPDPDPVFTAMFMPVLMGSLPVSIAALDGVHWVSE